MLRLTVIAVIALALASPASAQFGGLKKKIKAKTGQEATTQPAGTSDQAAPTSEPAGGTVVLTADVVDQLLAGLKAGQAERAAAAKEDTPYGRFQKGKAEYASAKPTCEAAQATFPQRAAANQKMSDKYSALTEKMVKAQEKGDMKLMVIYQDSAMAMMDPSCVVKEPRQPDDYYEAQRAIEDRAENQEIKTSGMSRSELAMVKERATAILQNATPPGDASAAEKSAVTAKASELKPLLGLVEAPAARAMKPAPAPAPVPAAASAPDPQVSASTQSMGDCMSKNMMSHQKEVEALGKRAQAAQAAGDNAKLLAIADTLQQIQMAGCQGR
ncbi:MAG TPA: hypothetical protein VFH40_04985 [Gemmatimonadales bacterium]|jgi:hypothetical protein|nr:hypothetical protein [Gemmatimonadales bacterium]